MQIKIIKSKKNTQCISEDTLMVPKGPASNMHENLNTILNSFMEHEIDDNDLDLSFCEENNLLDDIQKFNNNTNADHQVKIETGGINSQQSITFVKVPNIQD